MSDIGNFLGDVEEWREDFADPCEIEREAVE